MRIVHGLMLICVVLAISGITAAQTDSDQSPAENCVMIIGDSIPRGTAVFEVPGRGFPVVQTNPFAPYLDSALHDAGLIHLGVVDLSVEATSLSGELPYTTTSQYRFAQQSRCRFVVIFPWLNALSLFAVPDIDSSGVYTNLLYGLANAFHATVAERTIIIMNYYMPAPSPLAGMIYTGGISVETVERANAALDAACAPNGILTTLAQVRCLDIAGLFEGDTHVLLSIDQAAFIDRAYAPVQPQDQSFFDFYWQENPQGVIQGDGVHLNPTGKTDLAARLTDELITIDPALLDFPAFAEG